MLNNPPLNVSCFQFLQMITRLNGLMIINHHMKVIIKTAHIEMFFISIILDMEPVFKAVEFDLLNFIECLVFKSVTYVTILPVFIHLLCFHQVYLNSESSILHVPECFRM